MTRPSFFVLGAARCGTTSLHHYLGAHPGVFVTAKKEPTYFAHDGFPDPFYDKNRRGWVRNESDYLALFADAAPGQVAGEASPATLAHPEAPARLAAFAPDARLVVLLRDPIERAHSQFLLRSMRGSETLGFEAAVREELPHLGSLWTGSRHYLRLGLYGAQLGPWLEAFPRDQLFVGLHRDLAADPAALVRRVFAHIGADASLRPAVGTRYSMTGVPRSRVVARVFGSQGLKRVVRATLPRSVIGPVGRRLRRRAFVRPEIAPALRAELAGLFRPDVARAEALLGLDLSHWLSAP